MTNDEEVTELLRQLQEARSQRARAQKKVSELEQLLSALLQENNSLEEQLNVWRGKAQDVKNLQEEINTLEEVRRGQLCSRCLSGMDLKTHEEITVMLNQEEYDDISMAGTLMADTQRETVSANQRSTYDKDAVRSDFNPYRVLVEKYQALLEVQRRSRLHKKDNTVASHCMSLQEELEMSGELNNFQNPATMSEIHQESGKSLPRAKSNEICGKKAFSATPTDFSEAETSSSGFLDETSNKATQTEGRSGSFLCSIDDGADCKLSIYDDISPVESRFQKTPEYRQTFSQIFSALKRAAEAKDEGEKLPLLDDSTSSSSVSQRQQVSILLQEEIPSGTTDDNQSVVSSALSSTVSEPIYDVQIPSNPSKERSINETPSHSGLSYTEMRKKFNNF